MSFVFEERVVDITALPATALSFSFNNNIVELSDWTFSKTNNTTYKLENLTALGTAPGIYKIGIDLMYLLLEL